MTVPLQNTAASRTPTGRPSRSPPTRTTHRHNGPSTTSATTGFPVEHTAIVGTGLRLVEQVTGRLTIGRAALAGAGTGAWFGLFIGVLFGLFSDSNWFAVVLTALIVGALWGAAFGAIAHAMTGGRRDFSSRSYLAAEQYGVTVDAEHVEAARNLLGRLAMTL